MAVVMVDLTKYGERFFSGEMKDPKCDKTYLAENSSCLHCENQLLHKDKRTIVYRTLFGKLHIQSHRLFHCKCQEQLTRSFNPVAKLLTERTSPELLYLESKFASLMSYGRF